MVDFNYTAFQVWYQHKDDSQQLLCQFRHRPGRHVWEWFDKMRSLTMNFDQDRLFLVTLKDSSNSTGSIGFPDLSEIHLT